ncbi:MAG TPA: flagellar basal body-associated FliL family protein [Jatrophihabitans sp.]|nr:flagellar basal body-associated FliL family protein [Jatrophihabitans sp.]
MTTPTKERPERIATNGLNRSKSSTGAKTGGTGDESAAAGKRKKKPLKLKLALLLVLLLAGGAIAKFTVLAPSAKAGPKVPAKGPVVAMDEMTLNLADGHYLRLKVALQLAKGGSVDLDTSEASQALIDTYSNQSVAQLTGDVARNKAKTTFLGKLSALYPKKILDAYYTEFVMTM